MKYKWSEEAFVSQCLRVAMFNVGRESWPGDVDEEEERAERGEGGEGGAGGEGGGADEGVEGERGRVEVGGGQASDEGAGGEGVGGEGFGGEGVGGEGGGGGGGVSGQRAGRDEAEEGSWEERAVASECGSRSHEFKEREDSCKADDQAKLDGIESDGQAPDNGQSAIEADPFAGFAFNVRAPR
eukprot:6196297-Pleurochrysis_carterae.AAC.1